MTQIAIGGFRRRYRRFNVLAEFHIATFEDEVLKLGVHQTRVD